MIPGDDGLGDLSGKSFDELYEYYRSQFAAVTQEDVEAWSVKVPSSAFHPAAVTRDS